MDISSNNREFGYGPARIRIKKGTTVTWTNLGDLPHTATRSDATDVGYGRPGERCLQGYYL